MEKQRLERIMMLWEDRRSEALLLAEGYLCTLEASRPAKSKNTKYCHTTDLVPNGDLALYRYPHGTGLECDAEIEVGLILVVVVVVVVIYLVGRSISRRLAISVFAV